MNRRIVPDLLKPIIIFCWVIVFNFSIFSLSVAAGRESIKQSQSSSIYLLTKEPILSVDFGLESSPVQEGFSVYGAEHENSTSFLPHTYSVSGAVITIDTEWPASTGNMAMQMIDRGENGNEKMPDLLRDWIGTDGRVAKVPMALKISGLPQGLYQWSSYHHDNFDQTGLFNVTITDGDGERVQNGIDISNGDIPFENVTVFQTPLKSNGDDIILSFEMDDNSENSSSFFVMNGFSISLLDTNIVPGKVDLIRPLNQLKQVSLQPKLKWNKSFFAEKYNVYLGTSYPLSIISTIHSTTFTPSLLEPNTTYYWYVEAENSNGVSTSPIRSFTTGSVGSGSSTGKPVLSFSHTRKYYEQEFNLSLTAPLATNIIYTLDCSTPSLDNGIVYDGPVFMDSTMVVKAVAFSANDSSEVVTNSYLFPESIKRQGKTPTGFPAIWGGSTSISADYEMDPKVINNPEYSSEIDAAFSSIPTLSLSMDVDEWFNPNTGMYVGYPNSNISREKAVTAEFMFDNSAKNFVVECGVQNQGGTSIVNWKVPKQSMRLLFKEMYGPTKLKYKLFPDSEINSINTLVVDGLLYSWLHPWDDKQRITSLYFRDQLCSDMQNQMGWPSFHGIYVNLYINGLYWGVYDLHERPDDAFMAEYLDADREDFDIIKHNPNNVVQGSNESYKELLETVRKGIRTEEDLKNFQKLLDLPAFIDYMVLNFYLGNYDWAHQNYYAARNKTLGTGFRFYTWDAEHVMRYSKVDYDNTDKNDTGGPTEIHALLKENEDYRMMFADAVYRHFFNDGVLTPENFEKSFLYRKNELEDAIVLESARWGDFLIESTDTTYTKNEFWTPEVNKVLETYIPQRRDIVLEQLQRADNKLFPRFMPPLIEVDTTDGGNTMMVQLLKTTSENGKIYFTTDGTDPRMAGGFIHGQSYTMPLAVTYSSKIKARFKSNIDGSWSALAEKTLLFDDVYGENMVINEIMYHPDNDYPEFIELLNAGDYPVSLQGFSFTDGIAYTFNTDRSIQPGEGLVLTNDTNLFRSSYGFSAFGQYNKQLSNSGETLILENNLSQVIDSVSYTDSIPWPVTADGDGYSLELKDARLDNALAASWKSSEKLNGTPYNAAKLLKLEVLIYPNPFTSEAFFKIQNNSLAQESFTLEVFNQFGSRLKIIPVKSYNSLIRISMKSLPSGLYFFRLTPTQKANFDSSMLKAVKLK